MIDKVLDSLKENVDSLSEVVNSFPWDNRGAYCDYLAQTYYYVTHTTKLLQYAADNSQSKEVKDCLLEHIQGESGHQNWAKKDLEAMGEKLEDFPEMPLTNGMYEEIYNRIDKHGPCGIISYAMVLEGVSAKDCPSIGEKLTELYGADSSTFIARHGVIDQEHTDEGEELLNLFNNEELETITEYMKPSADKYTELLEAIKNKYI